MTHGPPLVSVARYSFEAAGDDQHGGGGGDERPPGTRREAAGDADRLTGDAGRERIEGGIAVAQSFVSTKPITRSKLPEAVEGVVGFFGDGEGEPVGVTEAAALGDGAADGFAVADGAEDRRGRVAATVGDVHRSEPGMSPQSGSPSSVSPGWQPEDDLVAFRGDLVEPCRNRSGMAKSSSGKPTRG